MKTKVLAIAFASATVASVALRVAERILWIDPANGFYTGGPLGLTPVLLAVLAAFAVFLLVGTARRGARYNGACEATLPAVAGAVLCLAGFLCDLVTDLAVAGRVSGWRMLVTLPILVFFALQVLFGVSGRPLPAPVCFLPLPFWVYTLVRFFTDISDAPLISGNLYRLAAVALTLVSYTLLAKVLCRVRPQKNTRLFTAFGLLAAVFAWVSDGTEYLLFFFRRAAAPPFGGLPGLSLLCSAVYLALCVFSLNGRSNLSVEDADPFRSRD